MKPIEEVRKGDWVWSVAPETGDPELKQVEDVFVNETDEIVHVRYGDTEIDATPTHPFYTPDRGWVSAVNLRAGDRLQLVNGEYVTVEQVQHEILESPVKVYNFEVQDNHPYYVGGDDDDSAVLVHNKCNGNWSTGGMKSASDNARKHFAKHKYEVGAKTLEEYTKKATNFANTILKKGKKPFKEVIGATPNTFRYRYNGKYIDMAWNGTEHIIVSFGGI